MGIWNPIPMAISSQWSRKTDVCYVMVTACQHHHIMRSLHDTFGMLCMPQMQLAFKSNAFTVTIMHDNFRSLKITDFGTNW